MITPYPGMQHGAARVTGRLIRAAAIAAEPSAETLGREARP